MKTVLHHANRLLPWFVLPAVILWAIWPLVAHSWDHVVDTRVLYPDMWRAIEPDIWLQIWILAWGAHILPVDPTLLYQANAFHPTPHSLARSDHLLGMLPVFAPVWWLTGNPVFAFQLTMVASYLLCGIGMYALLRHLRCHRAVSVGIALLWALMFFRMNDGLARAQLLQYQYLPFIVLFFDRYLESGRTRSLLQAGAFLLLQTLTAYWHAYFAVFTAAVVILSATATAETRHAKRIGAALGMFGLVGAALAALSLPYLDMSREGQLVPKSMPAQLAWYFGSKLFPATVVLAAVTAVIVQAAGAGSARTRRAACVFVLLAAGGVLLSIPVQPESASLVDRLLALPRTVATEIVPGFRYLRDEYRFLTLASVGIYGLAALGLQAAFVALRSRSRAVASVALAAVFLYLGAPLAGQTIPLAPSPATNVAPPVYEWLAEHGEGGTLLELPISKNLAEAWLEARYMFFSTYHWLPLINGYTGHPPRAFYSRMRVLAAQLPGDTAVDALVAETGLRWIVVHDSRDGGDGWGRSTKMRRIGDFDDARLFEVLPSAVEESRAQRDATKAGGGLAGTGAAAGDGATAPREARTR